MPVTSVNSSTQSGSSAEAASRIPTKVLKQEDFLKLLVAQLTSQDPLNPKADMDFVSQMAQFSSLEQSQSMVDGIGALRAEGMVGQANGMLGRTVTLQNTDGTFTRGEVSGVSLDTGVPLLLVNGELFQLSQVIGIMPAQGSR